MNRGRTGVTRNRATMRRRGIVAHTWATIRVGCIMTPIRVVTTRTDKQQARRIRLRAGLSSSASYSLVILKDNKP